ncbi:unnamed protein product, partial [Ixodes hexagonus]
PELVRNLLRSANTSLDPCANFFDYACHNYNNTSKSMESIDFKIRQAAVQGRLRSPAGRTIFGFYKSCLSATSDPASIVRQAVQAVLDITRPYDPSVPRAALRLLLTLRLLYKLSAPVQVSILGLGYGPQTMVIVTHSSKEQSAIARFYSEHGYEALRVLNGIARANVTLHELEDVRGRVVVDGRCNHKNLLPNVTTLLIPGIGESDWRQILSELHPLPLQNFTCHSNLSVLRQNIAVLLTDIGVRKETRVALLTMHAVGALTVGHFESARDVRQRFIFCVERTRFLRFFWIEVAAQELTSPDQDAAIRDIFNSILRAVTDDAIRFFHASDSHKVRDRMGAITLLLASDMVSSDVAIPGLVANTFSNELAIKRYEWWMQKGQVTLGVTYLHLLGSPSLWTIEFAGPNVLVVPPYHYPVLHFDSPDDFGINAAAFELLIAYELWMRVLFEWKWSNASHENYRRQLACVRRDPSRLYPQYWLHLRLTLNSVLGVQRERAEWHEKVYVWSVTKLSRSQMFYMNIFFTEYCNEKEIRNVIARNAIVRSLRDFREAFQC